LGDDSEMPGTFAAIQRADAWNILALIALRKSADSWIWRSVCISHI
jgi:hypothetical protein